MIPLFSNDFQKKLNEDVNLSYLEFLKDLRLNSKEEENNPHLDPTFQSNLRGAIFDSNLDSFSCFKFYWLTLIEQMISLIQLHEEYEENKEHNDENQDLIKEIENDILDFWNSEGFALEFMEEIKNNPIFQVSKKILRKFEDQIISFYFLHISNEKIFDHNLNYVGISEIGDSKFGLFLKDFKYFIDFENQDFPFPFLTIDELDWPNHKIIITDSSGKKIPLKIIESNHSIVKNNFSVIASNLETIKNYPLLMVRISKAFEILEIVSPECFSTLKSFTKTIIPINEKGIVSYSLQSLPGISLINMFERSFLDLLDDLTHENGHHFLNSFLNNQDLINEDDDKIYYSPWRKVLRPIRGIYHATFTFFWALYLFVELNKSIDLIEKEGLYKFSEAEREKVKFRMVEEFHMLNYCLPDLDHAYSEEKITAPGMELIDQIKGHILSVQDDVLKTESLLIEESRKKIESLKEVLSNQRNDSKKILL